MLDISHYTLLLLVCVQHPGVGLGSSQHHYTNVYQYYGSATYFLQYYAVYTVNERNTY